MIGRAEVERQRHQLDATFQRVGGLQNDPELLSDFARYLCILISGFLEQAVVELVMEHVRDHSGLSIQRYVEHKLRRFTTANTTRIIDLFGSFDPEWRRDLEAFIVDARKDAVNSIVDLRHALAHGRNAGLTYARVRDYYKHVRDVVDHLADLCVPLKP